MIQCTFCGAVNEATVSNQEEIMPVLDKPAIKVVVPVWTCNLCERSWTDHKADEAREAALGR